MNIGPFQRTWPYDLADSNVLVRSDGGARKHTSAAAWCIAGWHFKGNAWHFSAIAVGALVFPEPITAFAAELYALEQATIVVRDILYHHFAPEIQP